jgi:P-type Cu+ transporter
MHREISHVDQAIGQKSNLTLYLLTVFVGVILGVHLWPDIVRMLGGEAWGLPTWPQKVYGFDIALLAAVIGGVRILVGSLESLLEGRIGADLALAVACIVAIYPLDKADIAAEIVFIGLVGECLESITFERTQRALRGLVEVRPRRCWLLRDGHEVRVLVEELRVGDRVVVKPGARVPVDGVVVDGRSALDMSALTGESFPVDKTVGDEALAGSLNGFGALTIAARRVAEHTVVGQVIELTARALKDKAPLERTADRLARYFLPTVLGLAAITFLVGLFFYGFSRAALIPALSVLVVACPCPLILATPAAVIAALGRLAGTGVLLKGGSALERLARVDAFAFDKTGTLTAGRLELEEVVALAGDDPNEVLRLAATAEQRSEHVLAHLLVHEAARRDLRLDPLDDFLAHPGAGVTARTAAGVVVIGTRRLLEEQGIAVAPDAIAALERLDATGQTALLVARSGAVVGAIGARDQVQPQAAEVLTELRALGIRHISLLTGDREAPARTVAAQLGIEEVHAELLPAQKANFVAGDSSSCTAFVGDGINDAPALARAAVGIAIGGTGTDLAAEAGDIVLMSDPLRPLPLLVKLSRETVRIIRQNIVVFAFGVNIAGVVLTAWLWPFIAPKRWFEQGPVAAVIYHQIGSLLVLLNSMRLLWFERPATSHAWIRGRETVQTLDSWMQHHLDPDEWLHWLSHQWRPVVSGIAALIFLAYFLSGMVVVAPEERILVRRFGRLLDDDLGPGFHWRWPWPVEELVRVQPDRVQTLEIGFRSMPGETPAAEGLAWSSPHGGDGIRRVPDEAVMITGDGNLVELQATVRFSISEPRVFLFEVNNPRMILRSSAEAALREVVATKSFDNLLTLDREQFQREVLERLNDRCRRIGLNGLGVRLDGLALHDLHPPQEVVVAYHEVTQAMEKGDMVINKAEADAFRTRRTAEADAAQIVLKAEAARNEKLYDADAERRIFLAQRRTRTHLSLAQEWRLLRATLEGIAHGQEPSAAWADYDRRRADFQVAQTALSDFRLFWDALGQALAGQEKLLIDSETVKGKRNFLLFNPDLFRAPFPVMPSLERAPSRSNPQGGMPDG